MPPSPPDSGSVDVDALIVGAGPVGLYAAYCAGFRGLTVALMDSLPEVGGQVSAMYPEKLIHDVAGFPAVRGRDLVAGLAAQADRYGPVYALGEQAAKLSQEPGRVVVTAASGLRIEARFVVVTGGIGTFSPPVGQPVPRALHRRRGRPAVTCSAISRPSGPPRPE
jgi:thioredoxin reductase